MGVVMELLIGLAVVYLIVKAHAHFNAEKFKRETEERRRIWRNKTDAAINLLQRMGYQNSGLTADRDGSLSYRFSKHIDTPEQLTDYNVSLIESTENNFL